MIEMLYVCAGQYCCHLSHVAFDYLKFASDVTEELSFELYFTLINLIYVTYMVICGWLVAIGLASTCF